MKMVIAIAATVTLLAPQTAVAGSTARPDPAPVRTTSFPRCTQDALGI